MVFAVLSNNLRDTFGASCGFKGTSGISVGPDVTGVSAVVCGVLTGVPVCPGAFVTGACEVAFGGVVGAFVTGACEVAFGGVVGAFVTGTCEVALGGVVGALVTGTCEVTLGGAVGSLVTGTCEVTFGGAVGSLLTGTCGVTFGGAVGALVAGTRVAFPDGFGAAVAVPPASSFSSRALQVLISHLPVVVRSDDVQSPVDLLQLFWKYADFSAQLL